MDPTAQELGGMATLDDVYTWVGINLPLRAALNDAFGTITLIRQVVLVPPAAWDAAVMMIRVKPLPAPSTPASAAGNEEGDPAGAAPTVTPQPVPDRPPTAVELGQVESFRRVCRLRLGLPPTIAEPAVAQTAPCPLQTLATGGVVTRKIKLSAVIDQSDEGEILPWDPARVRATMAAFKASNDGEDPDEEEDITGDQLAALSHKITSGETPTVDFAIWRPHGLRLARALRLTVMRITMTGEYIPQEIPGPPTLQAWLAAWNVFAVGMRALGAATATRLNLYKAKIMKLAELYGDKCWWLVAQADARVRSEHIERIRRRAEEARASAVAANSTHPFDPLMPWDYCFKAATLDKEFWDAELEKKCLLYITHLQTAAQLKDDGTGVTFDSGDGKKRRMEGGATQEPGTSSTAGQWGTGKGKNYGAKTDYGAKTGDYKNKWGSSSGQGSGGWNNPGQGAARTASDGRYLSNLEGVALCWKWNHSEGGCADACHNNRAHQCDWCRAKEHRSVNCPQKPSGWKPQ